MPVPNTRWSNWRLKRAGTDKNGKVIQIGISKKRSKKEYSSLQFKAKPPARA
jgi:hypothetical protein